MEWLLLVGVVAGILSGLLGVGGGIILTPFLHYVGGRSWEESVAISLLVIAIQSPIGVWRHARKRAVDWRLAAPLAAGGIAGVWLGDVAMPHLPVAWLKLLFSALLLFAAWRLTAPAVVARQLPPVVALPMGLAAGLVSRLLGVGGGVLTVPGLTLAGVATHVAVGTSLVPVFTNAALASGANLARGVAWHDALWIAAGAMAGAMLGARWAHALPERGLRRIVAISLAIVALLVALEALRNVL